MLSADNALTPSHYSLLCSNLFGFVFVFLFSIRFYVLWVSHFATYHTAVDAILCMSCFLSSDSCLVIWLWSLVLFYITHWICACTKRATTVDDLLNWQRYLQTGKIIWIFPFRCFCVCFHWIRTESERYGFHWIPSGGKILVFQGTEECSDLVTHLQTAKCNFKFECGLYSTNPLTLCNRTLRKHQKGNNPNTIGWHTTRLAAFDNKCAIVKITVGIDDAIASTTESTYTIFTNTNSAWYEIRQSINSDKRASNVIWLLSSFCCYWSTYFNQLRGF